MHSDILIYKSSKGMDYPVGSYPLRVQICPTEIDHGGCPVPNNVGMSFVHGLFMDAHVFTLDAAHSSAGPPQLEDSSKGVDVPLGSRRRPAAAGVDMEGSL